MNETQQALERQPNSRMYESNKKIVDSLTKALEKEPGILTVVRCFPRHTSSIPFLKLTADICSQLSIEHHMVELLQDDGQPVDLVYRVIMEKGNVRQFEHQWKIMHRALSDEEIRERFSGSYLTGIEQIRLAE